MRPLCPVVTTTTRKVHYYSQTYVHLHGSLKVSRDRGRKEERGGNIFSRDKVLTSSSGGVVGNSGKAYSSKMMLKGEAAERRTRKWQTIGMKGGDEEGTEGRGG